MESHGHIKWQILEPGWGFHSTTIENQPLSHRCVIMWLTKWVICIIPIGASCRSKATVRLAKQFETPSIAEQHFRKLFSHTVCSSTLLTPVSSPVCTFAMPIAVTEPSVTYNFYGDDHLTTYFCIVTINSAVTSRWWTGKWWDRQSTICTSITAIEDRQLCRGSLYQCTSQLEIGWAVQNFD